MISKELAKKLRAFIEQMSVNATDEQALDNILAYPKWEVGITFKEADVKKTRVRYNGDLYRVEQEHTTQADWTPDITPALYTKVSIEEWPEWVQPTGAQDAYEYGAKVSHNEKHWISTYEGANVWEPGVFGWEEVE